MKDSVITFRFFIQCLFFIAIFTQNLQSQVFSVDTILYNGDPNKYINVVFLGDGFRNQDFTSYISHALDASRYLFSISPFSEYKNYFNVFAIMVPSVDAGADHPLTAPDCPSESAHPQLFVDTYFNSTFDYNSI